MLVPWHLQRDCLALTGIGASQWLDEPMTAFFASRQCPGVAIRATMDWAALQARERTVVVSGFHSPLEQSVLKVLIEARCPAVVVLTRPVEGARMPPDWAEPLAQARLAVVSTVKAAKRLTDAGAAARNDQAAQLAARIVVAYASPGGALANLWLKWQGEGRQLMSLSS